MPTAVSFAPTARLLLLRILVSALTIGGFSACDSDSDDVAKPSETSRLFVAADLSQEKLITKQIHEVGYAIDKILRKHKSRARFRPVLSPHLTFLYLGNVETSNIPALKAGLAKAAKQSPPIRHVKLLKVQAFAKNTIVYDVSDPQRLLGALADEIDEEASPLAPEIPDSSFIAHISLGRILGYAKLDQAIKDEIEAAIAGITPATAEVSISQFKLYESTFRPPQNSKRSNFKPHLTYEIVGTYDL